MATKFKGNIFYVYHKAFAKKVAAIKLTKGLTVDWSIRDEKLYSSACLGRAIHTCGACGSSFIALKCVTYPIPHRAKATVLNKSAFLQQSSVDIDSHGRPKLFHKGKEICNYYLPGNCYRGSACRYAHVDINTKSSAKSKPSTFISKTAKKANI
ncbi:unnamed protein product [Mytilus coruscus]|uniref:C3H1-type domain-containing protein n=1 Tax=Mytilus coruscus TaxID=42192 RepID=A0A6J8EC82_MYTCO|nr:unnamed protein product [Mytilus coruscus]